jgi:hypothetical protein
MVSWFVASSTFRCFWCFWYDNHLERIQDCYCLQWYKLFSDFNCATCHTQCNRQNMYPFLPIHCIIKQRNLYIIYAGGCLQHILWHLLSSQFFRYQSAAKTTSYPVLSAKLSVTFGTVRICLYRVVTTSKPRWHERGVDKLSSCGLS